ncbi:hypothetical protein AMTR_s00039p00063290 [Amborella trichopoda]|uniref:Uncharacterized protein n=1 Tax=Amborella trichopoda TaxID=13333 RepID=U5D5V9_AMBTC|nr:hypothetical protein AMTR_s00039p00063290 [Amborella trichopoda]
MQQFQPNGRLAAGKPTVPNRKPLSGERQWFSGVGPLPEALLGASEAVVGAGEEPLRVEGVVSELKDGEGVRRRRDSGGLRSHRAEGHGASHQW